MIYINVYKLNKNDNIKNGEFFKMKKFFITMLVTLVVLTSVFAVDAQAESSKWSVGVGFGTTAKAVNLLGRGDYEKVNTRYTGFTMDVRGDYQFTDDLSGVAILSWDIPSVIRVNHKEDFFAHYAEFIKVNDVNHYLGLFVGVGYNLIKADKLTVNVSGGPEFDLNLNTGKFDCLVAVGAKVSYAVADHFTIDASVRGAVAYIFNGEVVKSTDLFDMYASTNKVTLGATYKF